MNDEIKFIISRACPVKHGDVIQTIAGYLRGSQSKGEMGAREESSKRQENLRLGFYKSLE